MFLCTLRGCRLAAVALAATLGSPLFSQPASETFWTEDVTEAGVGYQRPPKFDYTETGRPILVKRFPFLPSKNYSVMKEFRYLENMNGVEGMMAVLQTYPGGYQCRPMSEQQKSILRKWGQPDYVRGPYKSTRNDFIIEWAYHQGNRLFQFADAKMVYEGPLTDQERTHIINGTPNEVIVNYLEPNIRRETWIYRPQYVMGASNEKLYSFSNGKLVYRQESP